MTPGADGSVAFYGYPTLPLLRTQVISEYARVARGPNNGACAMIAIYSGAGCF